MVSGILACNLLMHFNKNGHDFALSKKNSLLLIQQQFIFEKLKSHKRSFLKVLNQFIVIFILFSTADICLLKLRNKQLKGHSVWVNIAYIFNMEQYISNIYLDYNRTIGHCKQPWGIQKKTIYQTIIRIVYQLPQVSLIITDTEREK